MPDLYPNYLIYRIRVCEHPSCCNPVRASANTEVSVGRAIAINSRLCPGSRTEACQVPQGKCGIHAPVLPAPLAAFAAASLLFAGCRWPLTHHAWPVGSETARGSRRPTPGGDGNDEKPPSGPKRPAAEGLGSSPVTGEEHDFGGCGLKGSEEMVAEGHHLWGHYACGSCLRIYSRLSLCLCLRKANIASMGEGGGRAECRQARSVI